MSAFENFTAVFEYEKATKNTFKYAEKPDPGQPLRIGALYTQKWSFGSETPPQRLRVMVETASEGHKQGKEHST
jgi:hypothetical protein